jgi:phospholipase/carboxylesterase
MHGRGSDLSDMMGLAGALPPGVALVAPRAPFPGTPWGYGPGWAWYRFLGGARPEPESFEESQLALTEFLAALPAELGFAPGVIALGGFSQGGTMGVAHALRSPGEIPMILNFSGFLAEHPTVRATPESVDGTRFFWGHGTEDPAIPFALAIRGREALAAAGADLTARDYHAGHTITRDELRDAMGWLRDGIAGLLGGAGASERDNRGNL